MLVYRVTFKSGREETIRWPNFDLLDAWKAAGKSGVRPFVFTGKSPDGRITAIDMGEVESMTIDPADPAKAGGDQPSAN
jgi:hypothetical protein